MGKLLLIHKVVELLHFPTKIQTSSWTYAGSIWSERKRTREMSQFVCSSNKGNYFCYVCWLVNEGGLMMVKCLLYVTVFISVPLYLFIFIIVYPLTCNSIIV